jgi:hypothetical protein
MENEDPETILPLGSGDESELDDDDQNMILLVNNEDDHERRLSSASSVTQSMHPIDYTSAPSQLQLGFHEPETNTANSPIHHLSIHQDNTPTITDLTSDNADPTMNVSMHRHHHHHHQEPLMHDESEYQKMQRELSLAQFTISKLQLSNQQLQARNQQLEEALGLTKSVKPSTIQQPGGYMSSVCTTMPNNNYLQLNHQNSSPRLVTNHRSMFEMQQPKPPLNTPRPNYNNNGFYFHQQNDIKQEDSTWFNHHHRDSLSAAAVDSASVMPTTESNTATENIVKAERLKTASPLTVHNNTNKRHATVNNDTTRNNKLDLNGHMHFDNNYM